MSYVLLRTESAGSMPDSTEKRDPNVVDIAAARRRQKTVRSGGSGRPGGAGGGKEPKKGFGKTAAMYVQFIILLALVAYMMTLCRGGG